MANTRKLGPVRQLSLQCENNTNSRPSLKKQLSEDISENPIRISLSAKSRMQIQDRPPPLKLAWGEVNNENKTNKNLFTKNSLLINPRLNLWNERDKSKHLNIVLSRVNSEEIIDGKDDNLIEDNEHVEKSPPVIVQHQQISNEDNSYKNIFQKQIRKVTTEDMNLLSSYTPTKSDECIKRTDAIVVVPIIERIKPSEEAPEESIKINSRPSTAAKKREMFQKRTNSAFNASVKSDCKPPLIRASSVPHNSHKTENKSKFVATKRRLKSAKRKDYKSILEDEDKNDCSRKGDVVTMISLISPSGSDIEEEVIENPKVKTSPKKTNLSKKEESGKSFSLRKTVKSVSFQQSSIHAVRSFSASFPSRRSSVATTMLLGNAARKLISQKHDKPSPMDADPIDAKRRLLKPSSATPISQESKPVPETHIKEDTSKISDNEAKENIATIPVKNEEIIESPKEKECWATYCKISESGIRVSFDTILRGMLTPTEYRLRRKLSEQRENSQDNC